MKTKRVALLGIAIALAMVMSYLESIIPIHFAVPGIKIGLANLVIIFILYRMSLVDACIVSMVRVFLVSLLFGNLVMLLYSLAGAVFSLLVMVLFKRIDRFSMFGVSIAGGISHNIAQIAVAMIVMETSQIAYYLPVLIISGIVTGALIGIIGTILVKHLRLP